eukprot:TRINITY_DN13655_c0_g1_i1.p1 TRINITY_DN13655_c0_g1~~TRINITY_DN13655_c0_g1_i1.p1  ORF type:complete len:219 (-),score=27.89 TRINITY_DN13655_c0_g1_i1:3-659(-)
MALRLSMIRMFTPLVRPRPRIATTAASQFRRTLATPAATEGSSPLFGDLTVAEAADAPKVQKQAFARLWDLPISTQKLMMLGRQIRGLSVQEGIKQMQFSLKKAAVSMKKVLTLAKANAENNYGLDGSRLLIDRIIVGRGTMRTKMRFHARGKFGIVRPPNANIHVYVKEVPLVAGEFRLGKSGWSNDTWARVKPEKFPLPADRIDAPRNPRKLRIKR